MSSFVTGFDDAGNITGETYAWTSCSTGGRGAKPRKIEGWRSITWTLSGNYKVATVADQEMNDPDRQRERLLEAQLKLENGEIDEAEFATIEADVFDRIREIKARAEPGATIVDEDHRVAGVEITVEDDAS